MPLTTKLASELQAGMSGMLIAASATDARSWNTVYREIADLKARCDEILRLAHEEADGDAASALSAGYESTVSPTGRAQ